MAYKKLFSPTKIGSIKVKNRVVMTAMGVDVSDHDGTANEKTVAYYRERAKGGVGLIITEYTRINEKDGVVASGQLSMSSDKYIKPFQKVAVAVHREGAKIFVQLHHPGRQNVVLFPTFWSINEKLAKIFPFYWKVFSSIAGKADAESLSDPKMIQMMNKYMKPLRAPSDVPAGLGLSVFGNQKIKPFTTGEIHNLIRQFVKAAKRVQQSGADGVELHAGHGYLLNQFLSPYTNIRSDEYGGSFENRLRIMKELIEGIHRECGADFPISVRLTVDEFYEKIGYPEQGLHLKDGVEIAKSLEAYGADAINVTTGNSDTQFMITEPISFQPGWRKYLSKAVKDAVHIPVISVGVIRTPEQAEQLLLEGDQDFIGLARPLLADPDWAVKAKNGDSRNIQRCIGCLYCMESYERNIINGLPVNCAVNPRACQETKYTKIGEKNGDGRQIVIVGAGPAGLTAARELAARKFKVTLLEKEAAPGGQLQLAKMPPYKEKMSWCFEDLEYQAKRNGAEILYNRIATKELVVSYHPYAVIVAAGAVAFKPGIPGAKEDYVTTVTPILRGDLKFENKSIAVVGSGMTGIETAEILVEQGNKVTIIEMADKLAPSAFNISVWDVMNRLKKADVTFMSGRKLESIASHKLTLVQKNSVREIVYADAVVLSLGVRSNKEVAAELQGCCDKRYVIGDAYKSGRIKDAVHQAYELSRELS